MKLKFWILAVLIVFGWGMYDQVREIQREQINFPVAVVR
jgi:hypothetical protein